MLALQARHKTGKGQMVDVSMLSSVLSILNVNLIKIINDPASSELSASLMAGGLASVDVYQTADRRWLNLRLVREEHFIRFCEAAGHPEIGHDDRWKGMMSLVNDPQLNTELGEALKRIILEKTEQEWLDILDELDLPHGRINTTEDLFEEQQLVDNELWAETSHSKIGPVKQLGPMIKLSQTPGKRRFPAPTLGQHTDEILGEAGYSEDEIKKLRTEEIVF